MTPSASRLLYVDTSALARLVVSEANSEELATYLREAVLVASALGAVELMRLARRNGDAEARRAEDVLATIGLIAVTPDVLEAAARLEPASLRTLDAVHVATAQLLRPDLEALVTYDPRMRAAAEAAGMPVAAPGA